MASSSVLLGPSLQPSMASTSVATALAEPLEGLRESVTSAESDAEIRTERSTNGKSSSEESPLPGPLSPTSCVAEQVAQAANKSTAKNLLRWPGLMTSPDIQYSQYSPVSIGIPVANWNGREVPVRLSVRE